MPGKCAGSILILSRPKDWTWQKSARPGSCRETQCPEAVPAIQILFPPRGGKKRPEAGRVTASGRFLSCNDYAAGEPCGSVSVDPAVSCIRVDINCCDNTAAVRIDEFYNIIGFILCRIALDIGIVDTVNRIHACIILRADQSAFIADIFGFGSFFFFLFGRFGFFLGLLCLFGRFGFFLSLLCLFGCFGFFLGLLSWLLPPLPL